ncbi:Uncharacterized protein FWK35_00033202 [Aphis craccivora]|uniref:Reverse transcriptase domain-containing protein n=1 Tax=Aphis craccivora TaxID=307492 RepID=A0A6G0VX38_APHCR|nr:Uncharacterized protein FWK35_00033202 [Aphis craccivora]
MNNVRLRIVQLNMARSLAVSSELYTYCTTNKVDVAIIQEPYTRSGVLTDLEVNSIRIAKSMTNELHGVWAAIVVFNDRLDIIHKLNLTTEHTVVISLSYPGQAPVDIVSSYFQFRRNTSDFVHEICESNQFLSNRVIMGADVNAYSPWWHDTRRNDKGRLVEHMITSLNLDIENRPNSGWSFHGGRGKSNVDVTLSRDLRGKITNWVMLESETSSDHSIITFTLDDEVSMVPTYNNRRFRDTKIDVTSLQNAIKLRLRERPPIGSPDNDAKRLSDSIAEACIQVLPKQGKQKSSKPPWWNNTVAASKLEVNRAKRRMLRDPTPDTRRNFKHSRNVHVANIRKAKKEVWVKFVQEPLSGSNTWGKLTKWLVKGRQLPKIPTVLLHQDGTHTKGIPDTIELLLDELIPHSEDDPIPEPSLSLDSAHRLHINTEQLKQIVWNQKNRAPGADGITARIIKTAWPVIKDDLLSLVNDCLDKATFPSCLKHAAVVVLLKGKNKDPLKPKSYRPVSLLPVLGKVIEEVICNLIENNLGDKLSPNQHGFRPTKGTSTALKEVVAWTNDNNNGKHVLGCFLDISGAFDNVRWPMLVEDMTKLGCDQRLIALTIDYLRDRTATYKIGSVSRTIKLTRGCPQGSKFGPRLWNITMDPLLKSSLPDNTHIVAYADDIALLIAENTRKGIIRKTESALDIVTSWAEKRGLTFSREKSVIVPLKGGLAPGFTARMGSERIRSVDATKYLGLHLGSGLTFGGHAIQLLGSSIDMFSRLKGVRKSKWGVSSALAMMLYRSVYIPRITYGISTWYPSTNRRIRAKLESAQRRALLAVTGAYKTTSTRALQVIAGAPPINLIIKMKINKENGLTRQEAEEICLQEWQTLWTESDKGRWTHSFLPDVRTRMITPIAFDHYTTQILSGHGDFNGKLASFKLAEVPTCNCGYQEETARHVLDDCPIADPERTKLRTTMEELGLSWPYENSQYTRHRKAWEALSEFARSYFTAKEKRRAEERQNQEPT